MDSGASNHISGNKSLLSNIVYSQSLPTVTLANGFQTKAKGVGQANRLSSVTLDSILYDPSYPFSLTYVSPLTRSLHCDILEETGMTRCRPVDPPMDPNTKLLPGQGEPLSDLARYRRLVGKLNYLTVTRPGISFPVSVVSQLMDYPCDSHWDAVVRILRYIKLALGKRLLFEDRGHEQIVGYSNADWAGSPSNRHSMSGYCVLVKGNLVSWKSNKQNVVARSSVEAEYRAMVMATYELVWIKQLLKELKFCGIS
ncbi:secreted RxLR effector protein 161-like [Nicotiana tomentosiformis]|uniref:secreted RxLR effector protein 161-like n=1 Tax=Nicotiana tomentosiformis TaxID=4098 RepID=UPI00388C6E27